MHNEVYINLTAILHVSTISPLFTHTPHLPVALHGFLSYVYTKQSLPLYGKRNMKY